MDNYVKAALSYIFAKEILKYKDNVIFDVFNRYLYHYYIIKNDTEIQFIDICHRKLIVNKGKMVLFADTGNTFNIDKRNNEIIVRDNQTKSIIKLYNTSNEIIFYNLKTREKQAYKIN